jgi:nucleotide-binding universal stress UspA family protein
MNTDLERVLRAPKPAHEERPVAAFGHVIVCLDGSASAESALPLAAHLAELDGGRLTLMRVIEPRDEAPEVRATDAIAWEVAREHARTYVRRIAAELTPKGVVAEGRVAEGSPAREIKSLATQTAADLIVLSTHGDGGDGTWELGSTARKILDVAGSPLLVVPGQPRRSRTVSIPLRRIFVPLDGSLRGEYALPTALRLARADGAEIVLAHVASEPIKSEVLYTDGDLALACDLANRLASRADSYLEQVRARISAGGANARKAVSRATDYRAGLTSLAASVDADLVLLTAHGCVSDARRKFGSVSSYFIAHSTVPVLVLQDMPAGAHACPSPSSSRPPPRSVDAAPQE